MVCPESVPVFTKDNLIISNKIFEEGDKATILGWLQKLFLPEDHITNEDVKDLRKAEEELRKIAKVKSRWDLFGWEEGLTPAKAARVLNKCLRNMGYTEISDE
jgi:ribosomal protein L22